MGGGKTLFDENQQLSIASRELNKVNFFVLPMVGNETLFDVDKLYSTLRKKIARYLKSNGIQYEDLGPVGGGGGGEETLSDIIKLLWANKDLIAFILSFVGYLKSTYAGRLSNSIKNLKPRVYISFSIVSESDVSKVRGDNLQYILSSRLANLLFVSDSTCSLLCADYQYINFDFSIEGKIKAKNYSIQFTIPHEDRGISYHARLLKIIKDMKIKTNMISEYKLTKWLAIRRSDSKLVHSEGSSEIKSMNNYYLLFSSRIINDYFN